MGWGVLSEVKTDRLVEARKNGSILGFQAMLRLFRYPGPRRFLVGVIPATAERDGAAATPAKAEFFNKTVSCILFGYEISYSCMHGLQ